MMEQRKKYNRDLDHAIPRTTKWRSKQSGLTNSCRTCSDSVTEYLPFAEDLLAQYNGSQCTPDRYSELVEQPSESLPFLEELYDTSHSQQPKTGGADCCLDGM